VLDARPGGEDERLTLHWGAFTGSDLDLQLRRRGVQTVVIALVRFRRAN
jgi:nicotinamidase-related amidase